MSATAINSSHRVVVCIVRKLWHVHGVDDAVSKFKKGVFSLCPRGHKCRAYSTDAGTGTLSTCPAGYTI